MFATGTCSCDGARRDKRTRTMSHVDTLMRGGVVKHYGPIT